MLRLRVSGRRLRWGHCVKGQSTVYYYKDEAKYQRLYETYPDIVSPLIGVKNEHFNVWLRLGGLSDFRKLYGRIKSADARQRYCIIIQGQEQLQRRFI